MHVFIGIFKIVRKQSVAKTAEIQANTHARDISHRFPLGPLSARRYLRVAIGSVSIPDM